MRRRGPPTFGRRFVGNTNKKEVHDLDDEKTGPNECQIEEIIAAGHVRIFSPARAISELSKYELKHLKSIEQS